jgi:RimJ/RimL family protein N-acetyltransferase
MLANTTTIKFKTERLYLRQWREDDQEPFANLNADVRVMEFYPVTLDRQASDAMADRVRAAIADRGWGLWAVELLATQEFIGYVGLSVPAVKLPFSPCVEVGWRLAYDFWGKGLATEAAREALRVGFERLDLSEIVSFTAVINRRSRAVMTRIGLVEVGNFLHPSLPPDSRLQPHCWYKIDRRDWRDRE